MKVTFTDCVWFWSSLLLIRSSFHQHRVAKPECVSPSNPLSDSYLLCYCQAITQVIVNRGGSQQLNLSECFLCGGWTLSQQWHCCPPDVFSIFKTLLCKWRNYVLLVQNRGAVSVKEMMFGWIRPKKIKIRWYLEGRGTGPLSHQDKEMWQTRD